MEPLAALHDLISQLIVPHRRHSSTNLINRLVADIWAIRMELRWACLLDGIAISEEMSIQIADGMKNIKCLTNLVVLHERLSCSTFICSKSLWKARCEPGWQPICIDLSSRPLKIASSVPDRPECHLCSGNRSHTGCRNTCLYTVGTSSRTRHACT
ncbi:hypothetical protein PTTG_29334 [Puccinia triticina 1-1 BBBD Race 1]|uniref:Uncharacterized protein n=1 Tax=Puccinia triticina (isolate 1-1 / race 1 (BBBD)) TaxID=630390 RepID=A0A180G4W1_PUCT1|nr:hypothetical protein PTTG_29334 [Puccinia triticina 1-1 BBBD Race 1]WAR60020.1 hypothetical protein PtB15_11B662 [Puccinia triticina]